MAELRSLFLEIYIFILCVNAGIFVLDSVDPSTSLLSPFDTDVVVTTTIPSDIAGLGITNSTDASGTLVAGVGTSVVNGTGGSILDPIQDSVFFPFAIFEVFINFLTG